MPKTVKTCNFRFHRKLKLYHFQHKAAGPNFFWNGGSISMINLIHKKLTSLANLGINSFNFKQVQQNWPRKIEKKFFNYLIFAIISNSKLQEFTGIYRDHFTGKSVKLFFRFTGKFLVKAQP
jgi:hypothetical protein